MKLDISGDGIKLSHWEDGIEFPIRPGHGMSWISWTTTDSDDAWLVLDRNGNGTIDDGSELFGNFTPQALPGEGRRKNGFAALALFDDNRDGMVDRLDYKFEDLHLWQDKNHDGIATSDELFQLPALGVAGISVNYTESSIVDTNGNRFIYYATVVGMPGSTVGMTAWDVILTGVKPIAQRGAEPDFAAKSGFASDGETTDTVVCYSVWACEAACEFLYYQPSVCPDPSPRGTGYGETIAEACDEAELDSVKKAPIGCVYGDCECNTSNYPCWRTNLCDC